MISSWLLLEDEERSNPNIMKLKNTADAGFRHQCLEELAGGSAYTCAMETHIPTAFPPWPAV